MNGMLPRRPRRTSIGIAIEARRVAYCVLRRSPRRRRLIASGLHDCGAEAPPAVLGRLLEPYIGPVRDKGLARGPWVQVAIPDAQTFQAIVPLTQANRNATASAYFLEAVQATNVRAEDRIIDLIRLDANRQGIACVAASLAGPLSALVRSIGELGLRVGLVEPAAAAMFRAGAYHAAPPRGANLCLRVFLGVEEAVGVLSLGPHPLFWHTFALEPGREMGAILAAYSTLWLRLRNARVAAPIDAVFVHGRPGLELGLDAASLRERTGAGWIRCPAPDLGPEATVLGLALADPLADGPRIDLARDLKPSPTVRDVFPWGELAMHGALLSAVSLLLSGTASEASARLRSVESQLAGFAWVKSMDQAKLDGEKRALEERLKAIAGFRSTRVAWSQPLRIIAAAAPGDTVVTSLTGEAELDSGPRMGAARPKKKLVAKFETPLAPDGSFPRAIDGFLESLRSEPSLRRHFPQIDVVTLKAKPALQDTPASAAYEVLCLPSAEKPAAAAPSAGGSAKGKASE